MTPTHRSQRAHGLAVALSLALVALALPAAATASTAAPYQVIDLFGDGRFDDGPRVEGVLSLPTATLFLSGVGHELPGGYPIRGETGLWATDGTAAGTRLLRVWSTTEFESYSELVTVLGGRGILQPAGTHSLWTSDGTREGTRRLVPKDLEVGLLNMQLWASLATIRGRLLFVGCVRTQCSLWATDGIPSHTRSLGIGWPGLVSDFLPAARFRDRLYLEAGSAIYATDGTREGTSVVIDFGADAGPSELAATEDALFFFRDLFPGPRDSELWRSDGTAAGTQLLQTFRPGSFWWWPAIALRAAAHRVYFALAGYGTRNFSLATSDGTPGEFRRLTAPLPSHAGRSFVPLATFGDRLLFALAPDNELWTSDGRPANTRPLTGCPGGCPRYGSSNGHVLGHLRGQLLFTGYLGERTDESLDVWATDGTAAGTRVVADSCVAECNGPPVRMTVSGDRFYWFHYTYNGIQVWSSDLTPGGTGRVPLPEGSLNIQGWGVLPGGDLLIAIFDPDGTTRFYRTDGTAAGTVELPLPGVRSGSSNPAGFTALPAAPGGRARVVFSACDDFIQGAYVSDGTAAGTEPLATPDGRCWEAGSVGAFATVGDTAYYLDRGRLMRTDGTPAGTSEVFDTGAGDEALVHGAALVPLGDRLLVFTGDLDDDYNAAIHAWSTDGTAAGTHPFIGGTLFEFLHPTVMGGRLYFTAASYCDEDGCIADLYRTDGTVEGTQRVIELDTGSGHYVELAVRGAELFALVGDELWRTDGTAAGTRKILPAADGAGPVLYEAHDLVASGDALYFFSGKEGSPYGEGDETLYRCDGSAGDTVPLATLPVAFPEYVTSRREPTVVGGRVYFRASDEAHGEELWSTDGTRAGTALVADVAPGPASSSPNGLTAAAGRLVFAADDGVRGIEPWSSDGTANGTRAFGDIGPGGFSSWPSGFTVAGRLLFFAADDGETGSEPWAVEW